MNFSIVVPTWNRSKLVDALLESLYRERKNYDGGETEVLIVVTDCLGGPPHQNALCVTEQACQRTVILKLAENCQESWSYFLIKARELSFFSFLFCFLEAGPL